MFIEYGINEHGSLTYIGQAPRGATKLKCPYCGGLLLARKGKIVAPHFAHVKDTCRWANRDQDEIALPAYDNFNLHLPGRALEELREFSLKHYSRYSADYLERLGLVKENEWIGRNGGYELTKKGKLILGQLSLRLFNEFQEPLILERHQQLEQTVAKLHAWSLVEDEYETLRKAQYDLREHDYSDSWRYVAERNRIYWRLHELRLIAPSEKERALGFDTALTDLRLYRAQWQRILVCSLYFLRINDGQYYKIGVTTRPIEQRVSEIAADLLPHLGTAKIEVLGLWPRRGNVELYFKYRYVAHNATVGSLTEYYQFDEIKPVLLDLRRMPKKEFTDFELDVLHGKPAPTETAIRDTAIEQKRRRMISIGMRRAKAEGQAIGRPAGKASAEEVLTRYPQVVQALNDGLSLRQAALAVDVAINTVRKVKSAME